MKTVVLGKVENGGYFGEARTAPAKRERRGRRRMIRRSKYVSKTDIRTGGHYNILYLLKHPKARDTCHNSSNFW